jgi:hypothetical protein
MLSDATSIAAPAAGVRSSSPAPPVVKLTTSHRRAMSAANSRKTVRLMPVDGIRGEMTIAAPA